MRNLLALVAILLLAPFAAGAQNPRLDSLLDHQTATAVMQLIDSAKAQHLPTNGLTSLAYEGAMRHAPGSRIVEAVRSSLAALNVAKRQLPANPSEAELSAAAGSILSGVTPEQLRTLSSARKRLPLTVPLVVLSDLVARGVPVDTAVRAVYVTLAKGAQDDAISVLRQLVEGDIRSGASPGAAALSRLESLPGISSADVRRYWSMKRLPTPPSP